VLTALALALVSPSAWAQGTGYWHTSGSEIVDANGDTVRIAGINWYGFETSNHLINGLWAQDYKTVLNTIKSLGYNVIRMPFSNEMVETNPVPSNYTTYAGNTPANTALVGQTSLQDMDTIIAYAGSIGLRVILDNHRSEAGNSNEANGLWYTSAYPQANWIADWKTMATRYSASTFTFNGNPTVIGVDLRNEPHLISNGAYTGACWTGDTETNGSYTGCPASLTAQNWPVAATAAGNAVLAINPKLLVIVEGDDCYNGSCDWQGGNLAGVATNPVTLSVANQLVYSPHDYGPNLYQQPWFTSSTTTASLDAIWNKYWGYISTAGTAPVWLGEFGTDNTSTDIESSTAGSQGQWFQSLVGYLQNNHSINWTYWALDGEDSYSLLDSNYDATPVSSVKQSLLASIQFPLSGGSTTPTFTLAPSASTLSVTRGSSATDTITVTDVDGFTGSVTLSASGLPSGVTVAYGTNPTTSTSVLTFTASASATVGTSAVTITGTSGSTTATTTINLTVNTATTPSFTLSRSASTLTVTRGSSATDTITVTDTGGFTGSVTCSVSGLPSGVTVGFGTNPVTTTSVLTFTASTTATTGPFTITITCTSGALTATTTISLTVNTATTPSFTLSRSASTLSVTQGSSGTDTITVTPAGGFTGSVTLTASGLPGGVTAAFATNPTTATSVLTLTASSTATTGAATVTITGSSGTLTATTTIALTVAPAGTGGCTVNYTISPQNNTAFGAAISIKNGSTAITSWTLTWTFANGQTVSSLWNGIETQSGANVTVKNEPYNGSIAASATLSGIGFNGTWNGTTNAIPTAISLNGTACTVN
jgi:endoglucanase